MNNFIKAITYNYPDEIPYKISFLPATWIRHGKDLVELAKDYPDFFSYIPDTDNPDSFLPRTYRKGTFTDEWGCVWENCEEGMESIVTRHPLPDRKDILTCPIPECSDGRVPHGLMYLRLLDLRGFEEAMLDFADECDELQILIDKVLTYNCRQIEIALKNSSDDIFYLGDDLGMQNGLAIGPEKWRKYLKPCFQKMYSLIKAAGKYVYMHTDGMIYEIMADLREAGADMINPQFRANGLDNLVKTCKGKIPICLDLDRQLFPFASESELDDHVRECVEAMYLPAGGLALCIEFGFDVPVKNMAAIFEAVRKYKHYKK